MQKYFLAIVIFISCIPVNAQVAKLTLNGADYTGTKLDNGIIDFAGADAMLIPNEKLKKMRNELEYLRILAHEDSIQKAALKKIIAGYEKYENGADTLIKSQKAMIVTADSLFKGYKDLYHDLKKLCRINTFSITPGVGFVNIQGINPNLNLVFNVGLEYNNINLNALIGKKYQGATIGYRIGF